MAKERLRQIQAEAEGTSDTEEEPWRRPLYTARCAHLPCCVPSGSAIDPNGSRHIPQRTVIRPCGGGR